MHRLTPSEAASEIAALINSRPESPRLDEIEAIIAKVMRPVLNADQARLRAEWDAALDACSDDVPDEELNAAGNRVDDFARRILAQPVHGLADLKLLAEVCYWAHWTDCDGLCGPGVDRLLAEGPLPRRPRVGRGTRCLAQRNP
jgi:hypothetical protein